MVSKGKSSSICVSARDAPGDPVLIAGDYRGRYGIRGTRNAAAVTRDQYGVTRSIASRNTNGGRFPL